MDQITKKYWKIGILEELVTVLRLNARHIFGQGKRSHAHSVKVRREGQTASRPLANDFDVGPVSGSPRESGVSRDQRHIERFCKCNVSSIISG